VWQKVWQYGFDIPPKGGIFNFLKLLCKENLSLSFKWLLVAWLRPRWWGDRVPPPLLVPIQFRWALKRRLAELSSNGALIHRLKIAFLASKWKFTKRVIKLTPRYFFHFFYEFPLQGQNLTHKHLEIGLKSWLVLRASHILILFRVHLKFESVKVSEIKRIFTDSQTLNDSNLRV